MSCSTCDHFLLGAAAYAEEHPEKRHDRLPPAGQGICRRYPPRFVSDLEHQDTLSLFPPVHAAHRCGEFAAQQSGFQI